MEEEMTTGEVLVKAAKNLENVMEAAKGDEGIPPPLREMFSDYDGGFRELAEYVVEQEPTYQRRVLAAGVEALECRLSWPGDGRTTLSAVRFKEPKKDEHNEGEPEMYRHVLVNGKHFHVVINGNRADGTQVVMSMTTNPQAIPGEGPYSAMWKVGENKQVTVHGDPAKGWVLDAFRELGEAYVAHFQENTPPLDSLPGA